MCDPHVTPTRSTTSRRRHLAGFTLIELMIVVVIVAVLAQIAYGAYQSQVRKARRSDAIAMLSAVQQAQERWRANCPSYAASITNPAPTSAPLCDVSKGLGFANNATAGGYYMLSVTDPKATGYKTSYQLKAIAVAGTSQAADTSCATLTLDVSNGVDTRSPANCWSK
jgi:type IV pilus assembly protein PilE